MKTKKCILWAMGALFTVASLLVLSSCSDCEEDSTSKKTTLDSGESCSSYCSKEGYKKSQTVGLGTTQDCCCY